MGILDPVGLSIQDAIPDVKKGVAWWNRVFATPSDSPTITMATSSQITGTVVTPTSSYNYDPYFRYDGCHSVVVDGSGAYAPTYPELLVPETVTDAQDVEYAFVAGRSGVGALGVRVIVDGKLTSLGMPRFTATSGTTYYFRLHFAAAKVKNIRIAVNGSSRFVSMEATTYTVLQRPLGQPQFRHTAIGDSLQMGAPNAHPGAEVSGDYFYMGQESHSFFQSVLMGCDSYINLGIGGTGWSNVSPGNEFGARIATALAGTPHVLGFYGSRNDNTNFAQVLAAAMAGLAQVESVPIVLVCGPQQAGYSVVNDLVRQSTIAAGRTWLNLDGVAAAPASNVTAHPTFAEQLALARAAHAQLDMSAITAAAAGANASRPRSTVTVSTSPVGAVAAGNSVTITATVSSLASTAGTVQFYDGTTALGSPVTVSSGTAAYTTSALSTATHTLTARFRPTDPTVVKPSSSVAVTLVVSANLGVSDDFNRADGAVGNSLNGKAWDVTYAGWVIAGNALSNPTPGGQSYITINPGVLVGTYEFTMAGTYYADTRLLVAYGNTLNHVFVNTNGSVWRLWTNIAGTFVNFQSGSAGTWTAGDVIRIEVAQGSTSTKFNFVVKNNGTTVITSTDKDLTTLATNTKLGLSFNTGGAAAKLDNVVMTP